MSRKSTGLLLMLLLAGASLFSTAQAPMPAPGASSYLAGTADSFLASCRSDLDDAQEAHRRHQSQPAPARRL